MECCKFDTIINTFINTYLFIYFFKSGAKDQLVKTFEWRKSNGIDLHPVATRENKLPVLYAVRGYESIPDSNLEALPGVSESVLRINKYMGGTCLHKTDREGCPVYIERLVTLISLIKQRQ